MAYSACVGLAGKLVITALSICSWAFISTVFSEPSLGIAKLDNKLKEISKKNKINYISKIETIKFDIKKDFLINSNITFSDTDHWSEFGEIYLGKKLINNSIIKDIILIK